MLIFAFTKSHYSHPPQTLDGTQFISDSHPNRRRHYFVRVHSASQELSDLRNYLEGKQIRRRVEAYQGWELSRRNKIHFFKKDHKPFGFLSANAGTRVFFPSLSRQSEGKGKLSGLQACKTNPAFEATVTSGGRVARLPPSRIT